MEIIIQIGIVLGICLVGQTIASVLPVAVPGSVIGLFLLFLLLCLGVLKPHHIEKKSDFLLKNMAFFFIPAGVGILNNYGVLRGKILPLLLVIVITTVLTFAASAWTVQAVMRLQERRSKDE